MLMELRYSYSIAVENHLKASLLPIQYGACSDLKQRWLPVATLVHSFLCAGLFYLVFLENFVRLVGILPFLSRLG